MNVLKLQKKYPQFQQGDIFGLTDAFRKLDVDDRGYVDEATAIKSAQNTERQPYDVVRQALKEVELDSSRRVELDDYVDLIAKLRQSSPAQQRMSTGPQRSRGLSSAAAQDGGAGAPQKAQHGSKNSVGGGAGGGRITVGGATGSSQHTINEDERTAFTSHINAVLAGDADIGHLLPFPLDTFEMFDACRDGLVLAKLINDSVPDTIDERVLNRPGKKIKKLNAFHMTENNNMVIESAKGIGCSVVNIGSGDMIEVREHLILGLIWQVIRRGLLGKIDIKLHPELYRLLEDGETLEQFLRLPPEQILLRWFNYHLKNAKWHRKVQNFSNDVKDGENYTVLLNQLAPNICSRSPLQTSDLHQRAEQVLQNSDRLDPPCRKFLTPTSLVAGNPKLNLAFVANLFNNHPGLDPITEEEKAEIEDFDAEGEREARVFTLWLNSLDVKPAVVSFFDDLKDGTVLLQAYDKVIPGSVNWRHANKAPAHAASQPQASADPDEAYLTIKSGMSRFKAVENTNYAVELGKQNRFSLVGIQGADITDGQRTLSLGLVWQLMRKDITNTLASLAQRLGKREISDSDMVAWCNSTSQKGAGNKSQIRSFKDSSLSTAVPLLDVLSGMKSSYVDYDLVATGRSDDEKYQNAKLAISIARKMGATIWLVPEDITSVKSRLIVTFVGSLMATAEKMGGAGS
ncbi:Fimbrin, actin-bundling protein [Oleoguttula mirabilis]|uniref:Fimbrin n=1 Tax=Oleoguttula mirabilis TaxID=1507867 RepID=A0AAV9JV07_9PEZI|nr:Fimbrin, actin-bundling protein [Oleoguttula mirabilis]